MKVDLGFVAWSLSLFVAGTVGAAGAVAPPAPVAIPVVSSQNRFAVALYRQLGAEAAGANLFFSPYSAFVTLAMTAEGAEGETALQMGQALCLPASLRRRGPEAAERPWDLESVHAGLGAFAHAVEKRGSGKLPPVELSMANSLWADAGYALDPGFVRTLAAHYGTEDVRTEDFRGHAEAAREHVNAWVAGQTKQRILDLLPPGGVNGLTRLVLANAIYFRGRWADPFDASRTREEPFRLADSTAVRAPFMQRDIAGGRYGAFRDDGGWFATPRDVQDNSAESADDPALYPGRGGFQVLELPYQGGELAMVALLPSSPAGLAALESGLTAPRLAEWLGRLEPRAVRVKLPKYRLEQPRELTGALKAMGMVRAFTDAAQFEGMTAVDPAGNDPYVSAVFHKAFIDVDETGSEAAAASAIVMSERSVSARKPTRPFVPAFAADHAFLFLIRDVGTGNILFMGRFARP